MSKKAILVIVLFLIGGMFAFFLLRVSGQIIKQNGVNEAIKVLPDFQFRKDSIQVFTNNDIIKGYPTLIMYFSLDCNFCQSELEYIQKENVRFSNANVLLVSSNPLSELMGLKDSIELLNSPSIHVLNDNHSFEKIFGTTLKPSIFIYNEEEELIRRFTGETKPETILKYLFLK